MPHIIHVSLCRSAIVLGTAIPLALFLVWDAVILGSITSFERGSDKIADPLQQLQSINGVVGVSNSNNFLGSLKRWKISRRSRLNYIHFVIIMMLGSQ